MCGVAGFWAIDRSLGHSGLLERMTTCLAHRGPDDSGHFVDAGTGLALGHRRLSIVDLSPEGHQPMMSRSDRFVIVFNGEVYNYRALAAELASSGVQFRGHSDTEVMLAAFELWGLEAAVRRFVGIFAFALWDRRERVLHLVRDHLGVKPLYYMSDHRGLAFASELRAIETYAGARLQVDRDALTLLLRHSCVPAPFSIYHGVHKLLPGHILTCHEGQVVAARPEPYWSAAEAAQRGQAYPLQLSDAEAVGTLDAVLRDAVALQMVADVPLGAFLSGGIDSSVVVALMQAQSDRPVRTFSIGFTEAGFNEAPYARAVARHLGTDHSELMVTPQHALEVVPRLPHLFDEPFADSSQIPTFLVSEMARRHVTVALSGDGGDELFAGYNRHVLGDRLWKRMRLAPPAVRRLVAKLIRTIPSSVIALGVPSGGVTRSRQLSLAHAGHYVHKLATVLGATDAEELYLGLVSQWADPATVVIGGSEPRTLLSATASNAAAVTGFTEQMMLLDLLTYLPDDILTKVDRASMAVGLEARVPLLDHRVVELAWRLPLAQKLRDGRGKWVLRQVLERYVPREMVDRPKAGFGVPIGTWLRGPLREWAEELLSERRLAAEGYFRPSVIRSAWESHLSGRADLQFPLWTVLMFQSWLESRSGAS